jgi:hypothetical protein
LLYPPSKRWKALLTTHINISTLLSLLSLLPGFRLSSDMISNTSVLAGDDLLTFAVVKQLLVDKSSLLLRRQSGEVGDRNRRDVIVVGKRLDVLVRRLDGLVELLGVRITIGLVGRGRGRWGSHGLLDLSFVAHL